jgi:hypothetical protein
MKFYIKMKFSINVTIIITTNNKKLMTDNNKSLFLMYLNFSSRSSLPTNNSIFSQVDLLLSQLDSKHLPAVAAT